MFIHSIAIYYRLQMFVKSDSLNRHKMNDCSFQRVFPPNVGWFLFGIPEKWDRDPGVGARNQDPGGGGTLGWNPEVVP